MSLLATALEEAGGTAAPRERIGRLRALLLDELARSGRELKLKRSGRDEPVTVVFEATPDALIAVVPVSKALRADPQSVDEREWLLAAATVGALVEIAQPSAPRAADRPAAAGGRARRASRAADAVRASSRTPS